MHCSKQHLYSITSSARPSSADGTVRPSILAVLRFITVSYLVGACTGGTLRGSSAHRGNFGT